MPRIRTLCDSSTGSEVDTQWSWKRSSISQLRPGYLGPKADRATEHMVLLAALRAQPSLPASCFQDAVSFPGSVVSVG